MSDRPFHILHVDLNTGRGVRSDFEAPDTVLGGSGLAAALFQKFGDTQRPAHHPEQPLIFAIGPLTGHFPLMSKVVCAFKSPYNEQYAESHAGGRMALAMRFSGYDALVVTGKAKALSSLVVGGRRISIDNVDYLKGRDVFSTGKYLRQKKGSSGHRSIIRIGPAGENKVSYACINVDSFRHFGRLGSGAVMGGKNLKAISILGDRELDLAGGKEYKALFKDIYKQLTHTDMMSKYHDLGTAANLSALNELKALPWNNLQMTTRPEVEGISGERLAEQLLLRQTACAGCPVGCIHIGLLREKFASKNDWLYRQVSYDYEPVFACGSMLGITTASDVLAVLDECEKQGMDVMSAGVALAWATEAFEKGLITEKDTGVALAFDDATAYRTAMEALGKQETPFYKALGKGALAAAAEYGGEDYACVLGQEMAGYATGEVFTVSEALGFRHSHLDSGGYAYDQKHQDQDVDRAVNFMMDDERGRVMLTSMVSCLFARGIYSEERLSEALLSVGLPGAAQNLDAVAGAMQAKRWNLKVGCGFDPAAVKIPKRFMEVENWKGKMDPVYLNALKNAYAHAILDIAKKDG